ncbi:MAG: hypothetical protein Q8N56_03960 [bacterium]|nr:hypothetical protein [bacterium]
MRILFSFLIFCVIVSPVFVFAQEGSDSVSGPPGTLEQLKDMISKGLKAFIPAFKAALAQGLALWQKMYQGAKNWWQKDMDAKFDQWFGPWWGKVKTMFEQRKGIFKEELGKETKEMEESVKNELPEIKNNLWEKFLEIIK